MGIHVSRYIEDGCIFFVFNLGFKVIFFFLNVNFVVVSWFLTGIIAVFKFYAH